MFIGSDKVFPIIQKLCVVGDNEIYLAIEDPAERMALYAADEVAAEYLGSYYSTLYNYLSTFN